MGNQQVESIKRGREGVTVVCVRVCVRADAASHACMPVCETIGGRKSSQRLRRPDAEKKHYSL